MLRRVREAGGDDLLDRIHETVRTDRGSYLLFDASYARALLELGRCDACRMEAELARCFAD